MSIGVCHAQLSALKCDTSGFYRARTFEKIVSSYSTLQDSMAVWCNIKAYKCRYMYMRGMSDSIRKHHILFANIHFC